MFFQSVVKLSALVIPLVFCASAMAIELAEKPDTKSRPSQTTLSSNSLEGETDESEGISMLSGSLVSWEFGKALKTDVGTFMLPGSAKVEDRREDKKAPAKVTLTLKGQYIRKVEIYN